MSDSDSESEGNSNSDATSRESYPRHASHAADTMFYQDDDHVYDSAEIVKKKAAKGNPSVSVVEEAESLLTTGEPPRSKLQYENVIANLHSEPFYDENPTLPPLPEKSPPPPLPPPRQDKTTPPKINKLPAPPSKPKTGPTPPPKIAGPGVQRKPTIKKLGSKAPFSSSKQDTLKFSTSDQMSELSTILSNRKAAQASGARDVREQVFPAGISKKKPPYWKYGGGPGMTSF